jgi:hypothetical protein
LSIGLRVLSGGAILSPSAIDETDSSVDHINQKPQTTGEIKMTINMTKVEKFPEISRVGRVSEELQSIINNLHESAKTSQSFRIDNVIPGNAYNSMQQRIRAQAKKFGYRVMIRFKAEEKALYFRASKPNEKVAVKASDVTGVTTKTVVKK